MFIILVMVLILIGMLELYAVSLKGGPLHRSPYASRLLADCAIEVTDHTTADHTTAVFSSDHLRPDPGSGNVDSWCSPGEHFRTITWVGQSWG